MWGLRTIFIALGVLAAQPLAAHVPDTRVQPALVETFSGESGSAQPEAGGERFVAAPMDQVAAGLAVYGPFRVLDEAHAALVGVTDTASPEAFSAMLRDHPEIATIELVNCPGTEDDRANLRLGRMISARGMATHVPARGFVASGGVDLFVAGASRSAEPGAEFAVHSWLDDTGREPDDYAPDAPENRAYLDYYQAVGMTAPEARAFYAMTNSVPFDSPLWLTRGDLARWVRLEVPAGEFEEPPFAPLPLITPPLMIDLPVTLAVLDLVPTLQ